MDKKIGHPKTAHRTQSNYNDNSAHSQRMRLLEKLRESNVTTIEARRDLDILMPAARVFELRAIGHDIATVGQMHRPIAAVLIALPAMCWRGRQAVNDETWLERLQTFVVRFSHLGISC
jgi:hypothetical protein